MKIKFVDYIGNDEDKENITTAVDDFVDIFRPLEANNLQLITDRLTGAIFLECHILAQKLVDYGTVDAPLDPELQPDYRANRDIVEDNSAFTKMKEDAVNLRTFSNIVAEYSTKFDMDHPLKIIGGQHRFMAISEAFKEGVNELHGVKVYFGLDMEQRLDVQLISNTNIAVSTDLLDRMLETVKGPQLRDWCQSVGLLEDGQDFADRKQRGSQITVRGARTFILNYYKGKAVDPGNFSNIKTIPVITKTGTVDMEWEELRHKKPGIWTDKKLQEAGRKFAELVRAQHKYFENKEKKSSSESAEKPLNYAVLASWAYVSGVLFSNKVRLERHYALANSTKKDPLNTEALAKARHKTDPDNYRGLGSRTDVKERGRLAELFFLQAEKGEGITKQVIDLAIKKYHAKQAVLEVLEAEGQVL